MKHRLLYLLLLICLPLWVWAENASNVRVRQQGKNIIVTYNLREKSNVQLLVSINNGSFKPVKAVEGDVGDNVRKGENLTITWHPLQERESFIANNVQFKVEALGSYDAYALPRYRGGKAIETFILGEFAYSFAPQTSFGLMFGQTYTHGLGWFIDARTDLHFYPVTNFTCEGGGYIDGEQPFYSGNTRKSTLSAHVGFVLDVLDAIEIVQKNRFNTLGFYLGAGYGWRELSWETLDGQWLTYGPTSSRGFSGNIGIIGSIYGLTLKAGVSTINFRYLELETGIGWMF